MLLRHTAYYLLARGLPGLINFFALSVYTRLLAPEDYGRYALAVASVILVNTLLFQWMLSGLARFLSRYAGQEQKLQSTLLAAYLLLVAFTALMGGVAYGFLEPGPWREILPVAIMLVWVQAWFELNLQLLSSRLKPMRYGAMSSARATLALVIGSALIWAGWTALAPLWGLVLGGGLALLVFSRGEWRGSRMHHADAPLARELLGYGLPLSVTFLFGFIISTSDRYLIAWFLDERAAGLYSAGYDLAQLSLSVLMMIVNLAAYPIVVRALEKEGKDVARRLLERQGRILLAVALPASAGFMLLAGNIATVMLGQEFRAAATDILPWIAAAALLGGLKSYYFDLAFQLGHHTKGQVGVVMVAGVVNIVLNLLLIPKHGLHGAAWATLVAYAVGLILSIQQGRRHFHMTCVPHDTWRIMLATGLMIAALWPLRDSLGFAALSGQVLFGVAVYGAAIIALDIGGARAVGARFWKRPM